jgi:hypothetical protein
MSTILFASELLSIIFIKSLGKNGLISLSVLICSFKVSKSAFISFWDALVEGSILSIRASVGFLSVISKILPLASPWKRIFTFPSGSVTFLIIVPIVPYVFGSSLMETNNKEWSFIGFCGV